MKWAIDKALLHPIIHPSILAIVVGWSDASSHDYQWLRTSSLGDGCYIEVYHTLTLGKSNIMSLLYIRNT